MLLTRLALFIALLVGTGTSSAVNLRSDPALVTGELDGGKTKRSLRVHNTNDSVDVDGAFDRSTEERVFDFLKKVKPAYKLDLQNASTAKLEKILGSESKKLKAFNYLNDHDINPQMVYARLGGPDSANFPGKENFWRAYLAWYSPTN
ncbi:hypothetical protein PF005_g14527 [Phytophthora fragariae]|uniref:RxLR effector protein n=1 Tax=Phytophthora fragariae TaxID=53985 RepID=A0A6A3KDP7_9STRA|nr:hypothetical protein PF003_g37048 [Phytophthora fragariae]KAE8934146.1 hypothetical protein PF009_g15873 [Phytophthora fragariae]KAE9002023.1 hypothetical protein PF011_g13492 [Phytophthora fragariae]KAE9102066.1 hypothetical protein PF007_g14892 [Phytophthora fragariae]KAE9113840.1 hypothetical protein PF010_g9928 [Phytophthora fragariae]